MDSVEELMPYRKYLCVIDHSPEVEQAVYYAAKRASRSGMGIALLYVLQPAQNDANWISVAELLKEEAEEKAEKALNFYAQKVNNISGLKSDIHTAEGNAKDALVQFLSQNRDIGHLVLGAGTDNNNPGILVSSLTHLMPHSIRIPVTIIPGTLSLNDIDLMI
jgi:nucleotide-binding universal stress UspA family protein